MRKNQLKVSALKPLERGLSPSEIFRRIARWRTPFGYEEAYWHALLTDRGFARDAHGNYWASVGESKTLFTAHLDTVGPLGPVAYAEEDGLTWSLDGLPLGADDRAGIALLLFLHENGLPGRYALFVGEEEGGVGSSAAASEWRGLGLEVARAVSFDRKGKEDIITHQGGVRTASDEFAWALAEELNRRGPFAYAPSPHGIFTDSALLAAMVPECTNVSVGYEGAHTGAERQDLAFLDALGHALLEVDWENLPIHREPREESAWYEGVRSEWLSLYGPHERAKVADPQVWQRFAVKHPDLVGGILAEIGTHYPELLEDYEDLLGE